MDLDDAYTQSCEVKRIFQYCNAQLITVDLFMTIESEKELGYLVNVMMLPCIPVSNLTFQNACVLGIIETRKIPDSYAWLALALCLNNKYCTFFFDAIRPLSS